MASAFVHKTEFVQNHYDGFMVTRLERDDLVSIGVKDGAPMPLLAVVGAAAAAVFPRMPAQAPAELLPGASCQRGYFEGRRSRGPRHETTQC